jgi:hypothetical protein
MFYFTDLKWALERAILQISNAGSHDLKHGFKGCSQGGAGKNPRRMEKGAGCWSAAAATGGISACHSLFLNAV